MGFPIVGAGFSVVFQASGLDFRLIFLSKMEPTFRSKAGRAYRDHRENWTSVLSKIGHPCCPKGPFLVKKYKFMIKNDFPDQIFLESKMQF